MFPYLSIEEATAEMAMRQGLLTRHAAIGIADLSAHLRPEQVFVIATGDELMDLDDKERAELRGLVRTGRVVGINVVIESTRADSTSGPIDIKRLLEQPKQVAFSTFAPPQHEPVAVTAPAFSLRSTDRDEADFVRRLLEGPPVEDEERVVGSVHGPDLPTHPVDADAAIRAVLAGHCDDGEGHCLECTDTINGYVIYADIVEPVPIEECWTRRAALGLATPAG